MVCGSEEQQTSNHQSIQEKEYVFFNTRKGDIGKWG
jgi:hypothetical protein